MMEQPNHVSNNNKKKPSKMLRLIALCFAFSLPFILVKFFSKSPEDKAAVKLVRLPQPKAQINEPKPTAVQENEWKIVTTNDGDSLAGVFKRLGISAKTLQAVMQDNPHSKLLAQLKPQQKLKFLFNKEALKKIILPLNTTQYIEVSYANGQFHTSINSKNMSTHSHYVTATVDNTLYGTAKKNQIPMKLIHQMTQIFNWQIDFAKDVRSGDQFTIIYKAYYIEDKLVGAGEILAVTYRKKNRTYRAIRHKNAAGEIDYFDENGKSLRKAFSRYPVKFSHISSTFSYSRKHPILKYRRAHKGIDLAAPIGTPIKATSDGVIVRITYGSGYGNVIKIKHNKTYSSLYAHMLKFRQGLSKGSKVTKGEVIGYVGQTGLADGPHCHYEFYIDNVPRNPATVILPFAASIKGSELLAFKANAQTMLAHLNLFEEAHLAAVKKQGRVA